MMIDFGTVLDVAVRAASSDSSSSNVRNIAFVFLLAGFVFYALMFIRYRNVDKRHHFESETKATMDNMQAEDTYTRSLHRVRNSSMSGANNRSVRGARQKFF